MPGPDVKIARQKLGSCSDLWLGTEESLREYLADAAKYSGPDAQPSVGIAFSGEGTAQAKEEELLPRLVSVQSGVAVIDLKGKFVSKDSWWNKYAGLISYREIREAALYALGRDDVSEVILDISSPGGSVAGVFDAVEALNALNSMKSVTAYSDSVAASAGYWLMSTAARRVASPVAALGSIGVIQIIMEYTKMMADDGVTATVLRAGDFKALGNPYEVLSEEAKVELQGHIDHVNSVFIQSVSENLGVPYPDVESKMAQGREFIGSQAVEAGLINAVSSFDKIYAGALVAAAKQGDGKMLGKKITEGSLRGAAAAGVISADDLEMGLAALAEGKEPAIEIPGVVEPKGEPEASVEDPDKESGGTVEPKGEPEASVEDPDKESAWSKLLSQVVDLKVEVKQKDTELAELTGVLTPVKTILAAAINTMGVALGWSKDEALAESDVSDLVEKHISVAAAFADAFKVGGVAVNTPGEGDEPTSPKADVPALERAAVRAAGVHKSEKVVPLAR